MALRRGLDDATLVAAGATEAIDDFEDARLLAVLEGGGAASGRALERADRPLRGHR